MALFLLIYENFPSLLWIKAHVLMNYIMWLLTCTTLWLNLLILYVCVCMYVCCMYVCAHTTSHMCGGLRTTCGESACFFHHVGSPGSNSGLGWKGSPRWVEPFQGLCFCFVLRQGLVMQTMLASTLPSSVSVSWVMGLEVCTTTASPTVLFFLLIYIYNISQFIKCVLQIHLLGFTD